MSSQGQLPIAAATGLSNDKPAPRSTAWNAHATRAYAHTHTHTHIKEFVVVRVFQGEPFFPTD